MEELKNWMERQFKIADRTLLQWRGNEVVVLKYDTNQQGCFAGLQSQMLNTIQLKEPMMQHEQVWAVTYDLELPLLRAEITYSLQQLLKDGWIESID
ncbi:MAG: hypothetical protein V4629_02435 [Pseudomonadota bacterium]